MFVALDPRFGLVVHHLANVCPFSQTEGWWSLRFEMETAYGWKHTMTNYCEKRQAENYIAISADN